MRSREDDDVLVSCICPTFGRCPGYQYLLEEAIESFLRQDYAAKELIVLNDAPGQVLVSAVPEIRIFNWPYRLSSLGAKLNLLVGLARGDLIAPWDDDDISLPWRISQAVAHLGSTAPYWKPCKLWYWKRGAPPVLDHGGVCHNASIFHKRAWLAAGGYPERSGAQDMALDAALRRLGPLPPPLTGAEKPAYIYRWGVSPYHLSGHPDPEQFYRTLKCPAPGVYTLQPAWQRDYTALILNETGNNGKQEMSGLREKQAAQ